MPEKQHQTLHISLFTFQHAAQRAEACQMHIFMPTIARELETVILEMSALPEMRGG